MKRFPLIPTLVVALAVAAMIGLGLWQLLDRRPAKLAFIAQLQQNPAKPPVAFPRFAEAPGNDALLFRRSSAYCLSPVSVTLAGAGSAGFRAIAACRTGAEGPGLLVQLGTTRDPKATPRWNGGYVQGYISHAPNQRPALMAALEQQPQQIMLVLATPVAGLSPNPAPNADAVPNNHLAYAGQWFFFAAVAAIIYALVLRRRRGGTNAPEGTGDKRP